MKWIGVIHLPPLPGSPHHRETVATIMDRALQEARALADHGAAGLILENYGDRPYFRTRVPPVTVATMAVLAYELRRACGLRVGINVLRNDARAALAVALAAGADFIRVNVWVGVAATDQGLLRGSAARVLRERRWWGAEHIQIYADLDVKHAQFLYPTALDDALDALVVRGGADAVIVTGPRTGLAPAPEEVRRARQALPESVPLWLGSGARPDNVEAYIEWIDGVIIGSALRRDGRAGCELDPERLSQWARVMQKFAS